MCSTSNLWAKHLCFVHVSCYGKVVAAVYLKCIKVCNCNQAYSVLTSPESSSASDILIVLLNCNLSRD
jgi:hypothetical protein